MSDRTYFFIVGVGRSGTTLLMSMLNAHPKFSLLPETHFVTKYIVRMSGPTADEMADLLKSDRRFSRLDMEIDQILPADAPASKLVDVSQMYRRMLDIYGDRHDAAIVGDKAPKYIECLPALEALVPGARLIHVIRDPRDVFLSRRKADWSAGRADWKQCLAYRVQYEAGRTEGPAIFGDRYTEVRYEELIANPESVLQRVVSFLGETFDSAMLEFQDAAREIVAPEEKSWKRKVLGPLVADNVGKWRNELDTATVRKIESYCSPAFASGQYHRAEPESARGPRLFDSLSDFLRDKTMGALSGLYRRHCARRNARAVARIHGARTH